VKKEVALVLELREELANARQEGAKSLESAKAKMIDEVKELKNETENLKVRNFFCSVRATN
jgi:F0F1-type ATP synthase membrane subunit b/b'